MGASRVPEKIKPRQKDTKTRNRPGRKAAALAKENSEEKEEPLEIIRGSGNLYRDLGVPDPEIRQFKAILAAEIIKRMDKDKLTVREAHGLTGIDAGDFSRVRNADFRRISIERLMNMVHRLGANIELRIRPGRATANRIATTRT